jgi:PQQ-dependent dehydrogenase (methanol/ethanol family)
MALIIDGKMRRYFHSPRIAVLGMILFAATANAARDGRNLFTARCSVCHGPDGHGSERGPSLANNRRVLARSLEELRNVIRDGIPAEGMPAFNLPAEELAGVTGYVRSLSAPASESSVSGDRAAGEQFFFGKGKCSHCHMALGRGFAAGPDLSNIGHEMTLTDIEQAMHHPSAKIAPGYEVVDVELRDGGTLRGFARNKSRYSLQLQDFEGRFHLLTEQQISKVTAEKASLMPAVECAPEECANLTAWLSSLTGIAPGAKPFAMESRGGLTFERVAHPNPGDWPTYHGDIGGNRHSRLDQINTNNVKSLAIRWIYPIDHFNLEVTPVVVDGVMYVTGPNQVFALDAQSGRTIWHYQRPRSKLVTGDPAKGTNRGVAVLGDRIFMVTDDAHLVALHRVTGALLWETPIADEGPLGNYGNTAAPLVVNDLVVAGVAGGDLGIRGYLSAYRATTGERVWRFHTVPKPGESTFQTWRGGELERTGGGGATWMTGTYDPETRTLFWGVGNPYPAMNGDNRQGDNLYTASVLALNPDTGALKWYYQFTPHDTHDWDGQQTPLVIDREYRGRARQLLVQANRNGFLYVFDRTNGELLLAEKFVDRLTWASGIGKDGRPILIPGADPTREGNKACPSVLGASNWMSVAYSDQTKLFYLQTLEACFVYVKPPGWNRKEIELEPGQKILRAIDLETGKRVWELPQTGPADSWGGVLSTAGGLVFFGEDSGAFAAADAKTGKDLWRIQTNASTALGDGHSWRASPMTFMAEGKQYVAIAAGPNILCFGLPD